MTKSTNIGKGERKLLSKTTEWKYDDKIIIHTVSYPKNEPIYFSNDSSDITKWYSGGGWMNISPKPRFITVFKNRCKFLYDGLLKKFV